MCATCSIWALSVIDSLVEDEKRREQQKQEDFLKEMDEANVPARLPGDASKGAGLFKVSRKQLNICFTSSTANISLDPLCFLPHPRKWRRQQGWPQPFRPLRTQVRPGRGFLLHRRQQGEGRHLGRKYSRKFKSPLTSKRYSNLLIVRVPREPKEVYPRYQDGLWWSQEGQGPQRPHHVCSVCPIIFMVMHLTIAQLPQREHQINTSTHLLSMTHQPTCTISLFRILSPPNIPLFLYHSLPSPTQQRNGRIMRTQEKNRRWHVPIIPKEHFLPT